MPAKKKKTLDDKTRKQFETMLLVRKSQREICSVIHLGFHTIDRICKDEYGKSFGELAEEYKTRGLTLLETTALDLAKKDSKMAIFLLKNWGNYADNPVKGDEKQKSLLEEFMQIERAIAKEQNVKVEND